MREYEFIAASFLKEESINDRLSIRFSPDGLSFSLLSDGGERGGEAYGEPSGDSSEQGSDSSEPSGDLGRASKGEAYGERGEIRMVGREIFEYVGTPLNEESLSLVVQRMLREDPILSLPYKFISIQAEKREKLLIPEELFDLKSLPVWMSTVQDLSDNDLFKANEINRAAAVLVSSFPSSFISFAEEHLRKYTLGNSAASFINNSLESVATGDEAEHIFIDLHERYFDIMLTRGRRLLFFNTFDHISPMDILYFTLRVLKANDFDTASECIISGLYSRREELLRCMERYMEGVQIASSHEWSLFCPTHPEYAPENIHIINDGLCV